MKDLKKAEAGALGYEKSKQYMEEYRIQSHEKSIERFNQKQLKCLQCQESITYERRENNFCSRTCSAIFNNAKRELTKKCKGCDNKILKTLKYCKSCQSIGLHLHMKKSLEDCKTDATRKVFLLRTCEHKCQICLNTEWNGKPIPLELDHISGDHQDNSAENLRIICPNCHAQTDTYKNKNKGREKRRVRYKKLKEDDFVSAASPT